MRRSRKHTQISASRGRALSAKTHQCWHSVTIKNLFFPYASYVNFRIVLCTPHLPISIPCSNQLLKRIDLMSCDLGEKIRERTDRERLWAINLPRRPCGEIRVCQAQWQVVDQPHEFLLVNQTFSVPLQRKEHLADISTTSRRNKSPILIWPAMRTSQEKTETRTIALQRVARHIYLQKCVSATVLWKKYAKRSGDGFFSGV